MGKLSTAILGDEPYFGGVTYNAARDSARLTGQLGQVRQVLSDRQWHTLDEIARRVGGSEAGVSARLRDLRKFRFGQHTIDRQYVGAGQWRYRLAS